MTKKINISIVAAASTLSVTAHVSAATTSFLGGVIDSANWSNGEPTGGKLGIINTDGKWNGSIDGYGILHTGGTITPDGFQANGWSLGANVSFEVDGGTITSTRGMTLGSGSSFTLTDGTVNYTANGTSDARVNAASLDIQNGTFDLARNLLVYGGGSLTVSGGTINIGGQIRDNGFGTGNGVLQFNGGITIASQFNFPIAGESVTFGGSTAGSLTLTNSLADVAPLNWLGGSLMELTVADEDAAFYQGLYDSGDLLFEGANAALFSENFQVSGSTLSLVPEPSVLALLAGGLSFGWVLRRRRS